MKHEYGKGFTMIRDSKYWNDIRKELKQMPCSRRKPLLKGARERRLYAEMEERIHDAFNYLGEGEISKELYAKMYNFWWSI
jgi:hypothetical protein